jgi:hypothetical protein
MSGHFPGQPPRPPFQGPSLPSPAPSLSARNIPGPNALRDTLSPGRSLPFASGLIPVPPASVYTGASAFGDTLYYTIATFAPPQIMPDGSVLGFRCDMNSPWASNGDPIDMATRYGEITGDTGAAPTLKPWGSQYGTRAALVIVTGSRWRDLSEGNWVKRPTEFPCINQTMPRMGKLGAQPLGYVLRLPLGDMSPGSGAAMGRVERTVRDQPFAVRAQRDEAIHVALAIDAKRGIDAAGDGFFLSVINGELFIAPDADDRRVQNV